MEGSKVMKDELGKRMKSFYEEVFRYHLPRRTNTIVRVDGKAFHTYTKSFPLFSDVLRDAMCNSMVYCSNNIQGCKLAYHQSDEVSFLISDYDKINTSAYFNGNVQKMVSIIASMFTAQFNKHIPIDDLAMFDARVFVIPEQTEVTNYFLWRIRDCVKNSISSLAQSKFSHKELQGKSSNEMQEMLWSEHKINWNDIPYHYKNGSLTIPKIGEEYTGIPLEECTFEKINALILDTTTRCD